MSGLRNPLHARSATWLHHGIFRRSLRGVLPLSTRTEHRGGLKMSTRPEFALSCPFPIQNYPNVLLAHGGGGKLMHQLIGKMFFQAFRNPLLEQEHDASVFEVGGQRLAFTTDSYVVRPLFFPGGD